MSPLLHVPGALIPLVFMISRLTLLRPLRHWVTCLLGERMILCSGTLELIPLEIKQLKPSRTWWGAGAGRALGVSALLQILAHLKIQQGSPFFLRAFLPAPPTLTPPRGADHCLHSILHRCPQLCWAIIYLHVHLFLQRLQAPRRQRPYLTF